MEQQRWLRQLVTGRIYPWAPVIAKRKDMVPYDPGLARARIEALKNIVTQRQDALLTDEEAATHKMAAEDARKLAAELTAVENEAFGETPKEKRVEEAKVPDPMAASEAERDEKDRQRQIDNDPHIQEIQKMGKKKQVLDYLKREFGMVVEEEGKSLDALRNMARNQRIDRIFEG